MGTPKGKPLALSQNIRLGRKWVAMISAVAYYTFVLYRALAHKY